MNGKRVYVKGDSVTHTFAVHRDFNLFLLFSPPSLSPPPLPPPNLLPSSFPSFLLSLLRFSSLKILSLGFWAQKGPLRAVELPGDHKALGRFVCVRFCCAPIVRCGQLLTGVSPTEESCPLSLLISPQAPCLTSQLCFLWYVLPRNPPS